MTILSTSSSETSSLEGREITTQLTEQDFAKLRSRLSYPLAWRYIILACSITIVLPALMSDALVHLSIFPSQIWAKNALCIFCYFMVLILFLTTMKYPTAKLWLHPKGYFLAPKTMSITSEGLRQKSDTLDTHIKWPGILTIRERSAYIVFYIDKATYFVLPKRAFLDAEQSKQFLSLARQYWKAANEQKTGSQSALNPPSEGTGGT